MSVIYKIEDYLNLVYEDLKPYIDGEQRLCALKNVNYINNIPDYTNVRVQQLYLLKYSYAYAYEYTEIYRRILPELREQEKLSVSSIGCGTMIDFWSLIQAMYKENMNLPIHYVGIDKVNWNYRFQGKVPNEVTFLNGNVVDCFLNNQKFVSDIYLFPKSICEFSMEEINQIGMCFKTKPIEKDKFFLCVSLRNSNENKIKDMQKTDILVNAIEQNGFQANKMFPNYYTYQQDLKISDCDADYHYPREIRDKVISLYRQCQHYQCEGRTCSNDCISRLNRYPISRTNNICYQIIKFERRM